MFSLESVAVNLSVKIGICVTIFVDFLGVFADNS